MKWANWKCVGIGAWAMLVSAWVCGAGELYHMVRVTSPTAEVTGKMAALGLPLDDSRKVGAELEIPLSEADVGLLEGAGIDYRIVQKDLEAHYGQVCRDNLEALKALGGGVVLGTGGPTNMTYGSMGGFYNYDELLASLDKMRQLYPNLCAARVSIGKTGDGRDIWMVKITKNPDANESKPECLVDGVHHAREPGTYTAMLYAMWYLLENYGKDAEATYLVDHRNLYFVPVVNVDGFVYNVQNSPNGGGMWRKNRRNNGDGSYGVDVNRNYPHQWGYDNSGSSPTASSETYRGPSAGSEPEIQAMMNFVGGRSLRTAMSFHTYQGLCMYAYGYANVQPEHADVFAEYGKAMTAENGYACGPVYSTIYPANGVVTDWYLHEKDILSFTTEIGTSSFWPAQDLIFLEAKENLRTQLHLFWCAGAKTEVKSVKVADGLLNAGQTEQLAVVIQNKGWSASEPVTVQVTCTDAYVTVSGGTWSAGSLDRRAAATNSVTATVAAGCPKGHQVRFTVTVTQGDWAKSEDRVFNVDIQGLCDPNESYQYVLITSRAIRDATTTPNVRDLIAHRQAKGITATIVAIEDILGAEYYKGVDDAETLRNFIRDAYNTWKTDFVLLGGDTTVVPMRKLWCSETDPDDGATYGDNIPSDLYFQCLDGNYNSNSNDKWGEPTDGESGKDVDLLAEVYLGRASVQNETEMANFVYKTLLYETQSDGEAYLRNHLLAGQYLGSQFGPGVFGDGKSYMTVLGHSTNAGGYATLSFDSCSLFNETTMYQYDAPWSGADMVAKMNSGQFSIIDHIGHGNESFGLNIYNTDVAKLTNPRPFFAWAEDCSPGAFDKDCLAERLTSENRSGAYAVVMDSRYGFGAFNTNWPDFDGPTLRIHRYFWNSYFAKGKVNLGALIADGHEDSIWLLNREVTRWCIYDTVFFGDPVTPMRGRAEEATIAYESAAADDTAGNGDGTINPGERVKLWVTLSNVGIKGTSGVEATLTCADSYVTVTDNRAAYGEMPGMGAKKQGDDSYEIQVAADCPTPRQVELVLTISDSNGKGWTASFKVMVYTTCQISGTVTLDGAPTSGVTIQYAGPLSGTRVTDAQGKYLFGGIDGTYTLTAKRADWLDSAPSQVTVPPNKTGADFAFTTAKAAGRVTDALTGNPLSGVTVAYAGALSGSALSGSDGRYEFTRVYGRSTTLTLTAKKTGYFDSAPRSVSLPPDASGVDFAMGYSDIDVAPISFDITAVMGEVLTRTLTIRNLGADNLTWGLWNEIVPASAASLAAGDVIRQFALPTEGSSPYGVVFDGNVLWVSYQFSKGLLCKLDPITGALLGKLDVSAATTHPFGLDWDGVNLWVTDTALNKIYAVDPVTGQPVKTLDAPSGSVPMGVALGEGYVWVMSYSNKKVYKLDPATGSVVASWVLPAEVSNGANVYGLEYFNGAIWVAPRYSVADDCKVFKLSTADGRVISSFAGPDKFIMDLAESGTGPMWMVSFDTKKAFLVDLVEEVLWLKKAPTSGTVAGGGTQTVQLTLDTVAAKAGAHEATIHIRSNDPVTPEVLVPVKFTVTSGDGTNQPPKANAQSVTIAEDTAKAITLSGSDPEGSNLTYTVVTSPTHGTLSGTAPSVTYTPVANYNGADSFTFKVYDGALDSAPATVSITVTAVNDAPTVTASANPTDGTAPLTVDFAATGADADGDALSYSWTFGDGGTSTAQNPSHVYASAGTYTATVTVLDGHGGMASANVAITVTAAGTDPSLVLYMKLDDGAGTSATDSSGNGHVGTLQNGAVFVSGGKIGNAAQFSDGDDMITVNPAADIGNDWTICGWFIAPLPNTATWHTLTRGSSGDHQIITDGGLILGSYDNSSEFKGCGYNMGGLSAGWHHVAAAGSGATTVFYIDGAQVGTIAFKSTTDVYCIGNYQGSGQRFSDKVDDVRVYDRALSASEVAALAGAGGTVGIANGSFETPSVGSGYVYNPTGATWAITGAIAGNGSAWGNPAAPDGTQVCCIQNGSYASQEVNFDAGSCRVTFFGAQRGYNPAGPQTVQVLLDGVSLGSFQAAGTAFAAFSTALVTPGAGSHVLKIQGLNTGGDSTMFIDNVRLMATTNQPPTANAQSVSTAEDTPLIITLAGSDPEGSNLTYTVLTQPAYGTLSGTAPNVTYTPAANYNGADSFTFKVNDGALDSAPATVSITVTPVNDPPIVTASANPTDGTAPLTVAFTAVGADVDGDALTYSWTFGDGGTSTAQNPSHVYASAGTYTATATVSDPSGASGQAAVTITVKAPGGDGTGLKAEYFDNMDFTSLKVTRVDPTVDFDWGNGSPDASIGPDTFSARWTGQVKAQVSETYTFYTVSDDGIRLWVNGTLVIDNWTDHAPTENSGTIALTAGQKHDIKMEFYENGGGAVAKLLWSSPSTAKQTVPKSQLYPAVNQAPVAMAGADPVSGSILDEYYFCATDSYDPDGTVVAYEWRIEGAVVSTNAEFLWTFATGGTYTVTLKVWDNAGASGSDAVVVQVSQPTTPVVAVSVLDGVAGEPGLASGSGRFQVSRIGDLTTAITVNYAMSGTAINGADYTPLSGTVTLAAGVASRTVVVDPLADTLVEGDEMAILTLSAGTGYTVDEEQSAGAVIIKDQTYGIPTVTAAVTDAWATEPGATTDKGSIKISRTGSCHAALTVQVAVSGTAVNGVDYQKVAVPVTLAVGQSAKTITIAPLADGVVEANETVTLTILANAAYAIGAGQGAATVTIRDNTQLAMSAVSVVATDADAAEPGAVVNTGTLTFSRTSRFHEALVVSYTLGGTASNGTDYNTLNGSVTIPAGQATKTLTIVPKADGIVEGAETVVVTIQGNAVYQIEAGAATVTIAETGN